MPDPIEERLPAWAQTLLRLRDEAKKFRLSVEEAEAKGLAQRVHNVRIEQRRR